MVGGGLMTRITILIPYCAVIKHSVIEVIGIAMASSATAGIMVGGWLMTRITILIPYCAVIKHSVIEVIGIAMASSA